MQHGNSIVHIPPNLLPLLTPIDAIKPNPRNARTHSRRQRRQLAACMRKFGFLNPIIVDQDGMILAGHGRWESATQIGLKVVPVIRLDHLTEAQKRAFVIADNRLAEIAGWDRALLAAELGELATLCPLEDFEVTITGFETAEIDAFMCDHAENARDPADDCPEIPSQPPISESGDVWALGDHRLSCGDARDPEVYLRLMAGARAEMIFSDPPYNVKINGNVGGRGAIRHSEFAMASGEMSPSQFTEFLALTLTNMVGALGSGSLLYLCMDWRHIDELSAAGKAASLALRNICVWNKTNAGQGSFYRSQHELVFVYQFGDGAFINNIELGKFGRNRSNVWTYPGVNTFRAGRMADLAAHPTTKPVALVADAIKDATHRGGIVLDPFMGSGTTMLAAEKVGRLGFGIEYEPRYVDVAVRRWQTYTGKDAIQTSSGLFFDEISARRDAEGPPELDTLPEALSVSPVRGGRS
jgi:DNA modification methylase